MRILIVNYRYFISGGPEKYMFNIKKMLEDNGHEVIPFSIHSNKNLETKYSKYFVEPIGGRDATYFDEVKKTPKSIWQLLTRSIYSREVEKAIKKEINDVKPDLVYIIHFVNKLSPSVITGASKMGIPVVLRLSDYFLLCPRFDFMYEKKVCEECLSKGYRSCIKKRCVKGSLFASVVRVFSMKFHKMINVYKDVYAFITPSEFLKKKLYHAGISKIEIERTNDRVKVLVYTAKPGVVIGKGGAEIEKLKGELAKYSTKKVLVDIKEVKRPDKDAQLVAENIAQQLENRISFRRAMKSCMSRTMKSGALGVKTSVSGRLGGADMARTEFYSEGTIPLQTLRADIDYGFAEADTTYGKVGVKVWIYKGEVLPTKAGKEGSDK